MVEHKKKQLLSKAKTEKCERERAEKLHLLMKFMEKNFITVIAIMIVVIFLIYSIVALSSEQTVMSLKLVSLFLMLLGSIWLALAFTDDNEYGKTLSMRLAISGAILYLLIWIFETFVSRL